MFLFQLDYAIYCSTSYISSRSSAVVMFNLGVLIPYLGEERWWFYRNLCVRNFFGFLLESNRCIFEDAQVEDCELLWDKAYSWNCVWLQIFGEWRPECFLFKKGKWLFDDHGVLWNLLQRFVFAFI